MIIFVNQPTLSDHEIYNSSNKRRVSLLPHIENFLNQHQFFKDKEVNVFFPSVGSASTVCILDVLGIRKVLKIHLSSKSFYEYEGTFLRAWKNVGVNTPQILEEGTIDGSHYILMDFVDAKTLQETYKKGEVIRKEIFVKMGRILQQIHTAKAEGFGSIKNGKGNYVLFSEWLDNEINSRRPNIDEDAEDFSLAVAVINKFIGSSSESSYCHNDFAYQNIFATEPLTVFDPIPVLNHPHMDLASAIVKAIGRGISDEASQQLIRGYTSDGSFPINRAALQAAIIIQGYMSFTLWSQTGKDQGIKDLRAYLDKTNGFLSTNP